jgi:teichuronic acid biosynthesis glycosyltransferase TuaG
MSPTPTISIITPAFNSGRFIRETLDSVLAQSFTDWEMVIVDDCSSDNTIAVVDECARREDRIRWARSRTNQGAGLTRNQALALARGRYVAFLDADDFWDSTKLERQLRFMQQRACGFSYSGYRVIDERGEPLGQLGAVPVSTTYFDLLKRNRIGCLTVMLDREQVGDVRFPPLRTNQDFALWLQLLRSGVTAFGLDEALATYRIVGNSNTRNKFKSARNVWKVYRCQGLPIIQTVWLYGHYVAHGTQKHIRTNAYRASPALGGSTQPEA